jgi:hypothetical protein
MPLDRQRLRPNLRFLFVGQLIALVCAVGVRKLEDLHEFEEESRGAVDVDTNVNQIMVMPSACISERKFLTSCSPMTTRTLVATVLRLLLGWVLRFETETETEFSSRGKRCSDEPRIQTSFDHELRSLFTSALDVIVDISTHETVLNLLLCRRVRRFPYRRGHGLDVGRRLSESISLTREVGYRTYQCGPHCRDPEVFRTLPERVACM